jgi:hypothetical protein
MPQLVDLGSRTSDGTLRDLNRAADEVLAGDGIGDSLGVDVDQTNARILWTTVVLAVAEVSQPGLQALGVVLADTRAVGLNLCGTGDGSPLAVGVDEADVDIGGVVEIVSLAGLGVGVKDEVDAVALLLSNV